MRFIFDEHWRFDRLLKVLDFVRGLGVFDVFRVDALEDHEGLLTVHWGNIQPTEEWKTLFHVAWSMQNEPYGMVEHEIQEAG